MSKFDIVFWGLWLGIGMILIDYWLIPGWLYG